MYIFLQVLQPLIPIHTFFIFLFCFAPAKSRLRLVTYMRQAKLWAQFHFISVRFAAHVSLPYCSGSVAACCQSATCTCCCNTLTLDCHSLATKYEHNTQTDVPPNLAYWPSGSELPNMSGYDEYRTTQQSQFLPQKMLIIFWWISHWRFYRLCLRL